MRISSITRFIVVVLILNLLLGIAFDYPIVYLLMFVGYIGYRYYKKTRVVNQNSSSNGFQQQNTWNSTENNSWNSNTSSETNSNDVFEAEYVEREVK